MSQKVVSFNGWGISNLEEKLHEITLSPSILSTEDYESEALMFLETSFENKTVGILTQSDDYDLLEYASGNLNDPTNNVTGTGVSIFISFKMSMYARQEYSVIIEQITAAITDLIDFSNELVVDPTKDIKTFVEKYYTEVSDSDVIV